MKITFVELTQEQVENFDANRPVTGSVNASVGNGAIVRAAIKAGWFTEPKITEEEVKTMKPGKVNSLAKAVIEEYARVMTFDPL
jgi:hypothetical protein